MITSIRKSYIKWEEVYKFIEDNVKYLKSKLDIKSWDDIALFTFYRGGLPMAVTFSNMCNNIDINIIKYQTRDGKNGPDKKPVMMNGIDVDDAFKWCYENNKKIVIVEDLIDSGKTIDAIIDIKNKVKDDLQITILTLLANYEYIKKIQEKEKNFRIISNYMLDEDKWIVFPWENQEI